MRLLWLVDARPAPLARPLGAILLDLRGLDAVRIDFWYEIAPPWACRIELAQRWYLGSGQSRSGALLQAAAAVLVWAWHDASQATYERIYEVALRCWAPLYFALLWLDRRVWRPIAALVKKHEP